MTQAGDTIDTVAKKYNVPWQLLAKINGLMPPGATSADDAAKDQPLPAGKQLKVVRGPFDAVIQLDKHELTLMVQRTLRRPVSHRRRPRPAETRRRLYRAREGPQSHLLRPRWHNIEPQRSDEPAGQRLDRFDRPHRNPRRQRPQGIGRDDNRGAICVGDRDLQDLYGILSVGSRVTIMR